jgi:hypothetical protein
MDDGTGHIVLKCLGNIDGPRFLDGRTADGTVGLASGTEGGFTGTHWDVIDDGAGHLVLKCSGNIDGPRLLEGRTADGTVGLATTAAVPHTGTHWEIHVDPPAQHIEVARGVGKGVQVYTFNAKVQPPAWTSSMPAAFLIDGDTKLLSFHYKGPVWEHPDGSIVRGAVAASVKLHPESIAWLRIDAKPDSSGKQGVFSNVNLIQRISTKGGNHPGPNPQPGEVASVPYEAEYVFWAPKP